MAELGRPRFLRSAGARPSPIPLWSGWVVTLSAEDVQLDLDAEEGLENAVMEVAGNAAAFRLDGAGAEMAQQEDVFEGGADVAGDALEPGQVIAA